MGRAVRCPGCGCRFNIHGYEACKTCRKCGRMFNPANHWAETLKVTCTSCRFRGEAPIDWKPQPDGSRDGCIFCPDCGSFVWSVGNDG